MSIDHSIEQYGYRHIPGFPGYCVGDDGSVWSCWRNNGPCARTIGTKWKEMRQHISQKRSYVTLNKNNKVYTFLVHRLILTSFIGPCPKGMECAHWDGNSLNNKLDNLRWTTHKDNEKDKIRYGVNNKGERHGIAKLTNKQVLEIRRLHAKGVKGVILSKMFNVSTGLISLVWNRKIWTHV